MLTDLLMRFGMSSFAIAHLVMKRRFLNHAVLHSHFRDPDSTGHLHIIAFPFGTFQASSSNLVTEKKIQDGEEEIFGLQ